MPEIVVQGPGPALSGTASGPHGDARAVLLHGLTATRHYTVMGSRHLDRRGIATVAYDARGHGESVPADGAPLAYGYRALADDLAAVIDASAPGGDRIVVLGISMGAHTAVRYALDHPGRVGGLVLVTPAHLEAPPPGSAPADLGAWTRLATALRGPEPIDAFIEASELRTLPEEYRATVALAIRQRLSRHRNLTAVADALEGVPASSPFDRLADLAGIGVPTIVVGSRDEVDPGHPLRVAEAWAATLPDARLEVEEAGKSPIAWQGGRLARFVEELAIP